MAEKSHVLQIIGLHPGLHPLHMVEIRIVRRVFQFVGPAKAYEVGRYNAHAGRHKNGDHLAVQKRPSRFAMHQQHQGAVPRAFVDMCDPQNTNFGVTGLEGEIRHVGKPGFGRA